MKTTIKYSLLVALACSCVFAQATTTTDVPNYKPQEVVIRIDQQTPKPPTLPVVEQANQWVDFGKNFGGAMQAGLSALTEEANKFAGTDAGRFTMVIIAWKVMGDDAITMFESIIGAVVGIPMIGIWTLLYVWVLRRKFIPHQIITERTGMLWWGTRKYKQVNDDRWDGDKVMGVILTTLIYSIFAGILLHIIF